MQGENSSSFSWTKSSQNPILPAIPELFNPNFLDELIPPSTAKTENLAAPAERNAMMDALIESSHWTYTENGAAAYDSTLSPTLDAFQALSRYSYSEQVNGLLEKAWAEDPSLTLKIVWNLRSIHEGKSERDAFYRAFGWLYDNHPRTAIMNLHLLVEPICRKSNEKSTSESVPHGYWKDLLNILALATLDELSNINRPAGFLDFRAGKSRSERGGPKDTSKEAARALRLSTGIANHARVERKLADPKYRALYVAIARLFSARLIADLGILREANEAGTVQARQTRLRSLSLAAKWAPSLNATHDRHTNITTAISRLLYQSAPLDFPFPSALKNISSLDSLEATEIIRSVYRRWVISPLRAASLVTESFMSANRWTQISYSRVSSVCMKNNKAHFFKRDPVGFQKYLISVEKGYRKISGATLLPHQLIGEIWEELVAVQLRVLEAQWKTLVQNLRDAGTIENSIAICDVSGSMGSIHRYRAKNVDPIFPAVALSLLLSQLANPPFNNGFITFSSDPQFVRLDPAKSLVETVRDMESAYWEMNTDIEAVFLRLLLPLAIQHKVKPEDMVKRLFVFSDMQFDAAAPTAGVPGIWETNYDVIAREFGAAGYEMPEIVYWNLSGYGTVEVLAERTGVALMSGFSPAMLKVFMGEKVPEVEEEDMDWEQVPQAEEAQAQVQQSQFNPLNIMKIALFKECYSGLVVVD
ncbi:hypothetical protein MVEN_02296600 [Mycena venus]|uniref:DUF2828 domain-containing protein n=1 Tax=Mycena venus TaxID=2733690 RepID=A0A8H7CFN3_9AGAR|nr:hypothetical protein MVEN_02296600 [Mycena venus]